MIVKCPDCGKSYDDAQRWTICPHHSLDWGPTGPPSDSPYKQVGLVKLQGIEKEYGIVAKNVYEKFSELVDGERFPAQIPLKPATPELRIHDFQIVAHEKMPDGHMIFVSEGTDPDFAVEMYLNTLKKKD
jgi:hypothetical protein